MICKVCGKEFTKDKYHKKYCSDDCKARAKKLQDASNSRKAYILRKIRKPIQYGVCEYCGEEFVKSHGNQKYCCDICAENKNRENNADAANKYYHHTKKKRGGDKVWGLGSGSLGPHHHDDWDVEFEKVQNEKYRLGLQGK